MKINLNKFLMAMAILFVISACEKKEFEDVAPASYKYVALSTGGGTFNEGNGTASSVVNFTVFVGGVTVTASDVTVTFESTGDAVLATDYVLTGVANATSSGFSVVIPSGSLSAQFSLTTVANVDEGTDRSITFSISGADNGFVPSDEIAIDGVTVTIQDDDCAFNLATDFTGTASVTEEYASSDYGPYDPLVTYVNTTTLNINNFWDSGWLVPITVNLTDNSVELTESTFSLAGCSDWTVTGSGFLSPCTGEILLTAQVVSECYPYSSEFVYNITF